MLSDEEKEAIEGIKKDDEYYDILENIKQNKYNMWNVEKLMRDSTTGDYTEYEITQSIVYFVNLIEKQSKEIEELKKPKYILNCKTNEITKLTNDFVSKDKIKAKIEEVEQWELYNMKIPRLSTLDERLCAKIGIKYVLQSLLEKE